MMLQDLREQILDGDLTYLLEHSKDEDYPAEISKLLETVPTEQSLRTFIALPENLQINVFPYLKDKIQRKIIDHLPRIKASAILNALESNDRLTFFDALEGLEVSEYLNFL